MVFLSLFISEYLPLAIISVYGLFFTLKTKFFQLRKLPHSIKSFIGNSASSFGAVCTTLASTIGTGNIVGVATAISIGGAGAIFWMIVSAFFGMIIKCVEIALCVMYKGKRKGPFGYISKAFSENKFMLSVFGLATLFSSFTTGNITQTNTVAFAFSESLKIRLIVGLLAGVLVYIILMGGAKKVFKFSEIAVPIMSAAYILLCMVLLIVNSDKIFFTIKTIFIGAFKPYAVTGGAVGSMLTTVGIGVARGIFSNEAGMGTAAFAHFDAKQSGAKEGLCGIFEVFFDTVVMCSITGFAICVSGVDIEYGKIVSSQIINNTFVSICGDFSATIIAIMLGIFGITSTVGWGYFGISAVEEMFPKMKRAFVLIYSLVCVLGAVMSVKYAWGLAAFFNGVMMCVNMSAVALLSKKAINQINLSKIH